MSITFSDFKANLAISDTTRKEITQGIKTAFTSKETEKNIQNN
ncbi:MAG: hypothetical protein WCR55_13610 [Lentisphaerota bacterium]